MKTLIYLLFTIASTLHANLLPDYDENCNFLSAKVEIEKFLPSDNFKYFKKEVPKRIHRIWFGDASKLPYENRKKWEDYAQVYGYEYHLWSEQDFDRCQSYMSEESYALMLLMIEQENWWAASDILRLNVIKTFGGIYIDCDFDPPSWNGQIVDFFSILSNQGLTLMTERFARDIGNQTALFVANGFIVAPKNHPVITSAVKQVYTNSLEFYTNKGYFDTAYVTGPFLLNKVLSGTFNIVPCMYLKQFKMF
jgi:mannosyltransferase OCH1-like enzyme